MSSRGWISLCNGSSNGLFHIRWIIRANRICGRNPVGGYVQIPCIERNAAAAVRALDSAQYAMYTDGKHSITFDQVVKTMGETGKDLKDEYKETSLGGLAKYQFDGNC